ncbi:MAG: twin-arginine translocation signal domain-containing protein [Rhodospirillales bacterium]|nr:twin-arginine translocation signal domain-containing protein [Rhodospirillales bacterium]
MSADDIAQRWDRRTFLKGTGTVAAGAALGSWLLPGSTLAAKPKVGGTLVHLVQPEVPTLATFLSTSIPVSQAGTRAYAGLLEYNFDLSPKPSLAESWTVTDQGRTVTFKLRRGVKFHDGKPLTSADVQFSIMEVLKKFHPRAANSFKEVEKIETPDPQTAVFRLNKPAPYMMMVLSGFETPIVPKHLFEGTDIKNSKYANEPVGAGPFKFVEWKRGQYIRFDRFGDYFKSGQPYLERVVVRSIADTATRSAVLEKGEVHLAGFGAVPYSDVIQLAKLPHITVTKKGYESSSPIVQIDFNTRKAPFDNKKVRQAVAYALERKYIIDKIWFGFGRVATGPINSNFKASGLYTSDVKNYEVANGLEIANRLLDEAGFKRNASGVRFEVTHDITPYGEEWQRFGEYVKQRLDQLGIKVTLRYEDVATWLRRVYTEYDFQFTSNWLQTFPDPVIGVHRMHHSASIRKGTVFVNNTGWSSPKTDELMDKAAIEPDAAKRAQLYKEFQQIVVEECAITYIHELEFPTIYNNKYVEIIDSALGVLGNFDQAYLKS